MPVLHTIRFRITAVAVAALGAVLVAAGLALVLYQRSALIATIDQSLTARADAIASIVATSLPDRLDATGAEGFSQLVTPDGVAASSPNLAGSPALPLEEPSGSDDLIRTVSGLEVDDDSFRVLSRRLEGSGVLHVGTTYDVASEASAALTASLALLVPAILVAFAVLVWWLVGHTLRPVEHIRSEVAEITATDLHRRVSEPGTEDEIDRLAETMNTMLSRLEDSIEQQRRFVSDASHELRTPLTRLRSEIEVALALPGRNDGDETLESLLAEVIDMQHVVDDLLYLARVDEGAPDARLEPVDLDDLVLEETARIGAQGLLELDISAVSGAHVLGDRGQLGRAVRNLLDNAERHAESRITVRLAEADGQAVLAISDDGPGIAPEDAGRIFERFSRLDGARARDSGGSGLGLAIARDIVERHHGSLEPVSFSTPGASFELRLPLAP